MEDRTENTLDQLLQLSHMKGLEVIIPFLIVKHRTNWKSVTFFGLLRELSVQDQLSA